MRKRRWISHLAFILRNKVQGKRRKELGNFGLVSTPLPYALGRAPCCCRSLNSDYLPWACRRADSSPITELLLWNGYQRYQGLGHQFFYSITLTEDFRVSHQNVLTLFDHPGTTY